MTAGSMFARCSGSCQHSDELGPRCGLRSDLSDICMISQTFKKMISKSPSKSCSLDPISTDFSKQCTDTLLAVIKDIINITIGQGIVADLFKVAQVRPLLEKANLNRDDMT